MKRAAALTVGLFVLAASQTALADEEAAEAGAPASAAPASSPAPVTIQAAPVADAPAAAAPATTPRTDLWSIRTGPRFSYVASAGYDPFSDNDLLTQWSVEGQYPLLHRGRFALGVGLGYAGGGRNGTMRGDKTGLGVHTFQAPLEGRYHVGRLGYAFARVAPGATAVLASVQDASSPNEIHSTRWVFSTDLSVGAAILLGPRGADQADKRTVRIYALPEVGYTLATTANFDTRPDRDPKDALGTDDRTALPGLNLSAFYWRLSIGTTF